MLIEGPPVHTMASLTQASAINEISMNDLAAVLSDHQQRLIDLTNSTNDFQEYSLMLWNDHERSEGTPLRRASDTNH